MAAAAPSLAPPLATATEESPHRAETTVLTETREAESKLAREEALSKTVILTERIMQQNLLEAIHTHTKITPAQIDCYATPEELFERDALAALHEEPPSHKRKPPEATDEEAPTHTKLARGEGNTRLERTIESLTLVCKVATSIGTRRTMEDAHIFLETPDEWVGAVYDGHGGDSVAKLAALRTKTHFFSILEAVRNRPEMAIRNFFHETSSEAKRKAGCRFMGATAVLGYINKKTRTITTGVLGDAIATVYRLFEGRIKLIPLTTIRNWSHPEEAKRAAEALKDPSIIEKWTQEKDPKKLRLPGNTTFPDGRRFTLNTSRGLGDGEYTPWVISEPVITQFTLIPGDILELACDGISDFLTPRERITIITRLKDAPSEEIAKAIHDQALTNMRTKRTGDNITTLILKI